MLKVCGLLFMGGALAGDNYLDRSATIILTG
jgi:hypothetical protein